MKPLAVLVVDQNFLDRTGGIARISQEQALAFSQTETEITYLNIAGKNTTNKYIVSLAANRFMSFGVLKSSLENARVLWEQLGKKKWDVIHVHTPLLLGILAMLVGRMRRIKVFFTLHTSLSGVEEFSTLSRVKKFIAPITRAFIFGYLRFIINLASVTVALNSEIKEEILSLAPKSTVVTIRNGRFLEMYSVRKHIPEDKIRLITVGSITSRKRQLFLLQTLAVLPKNYQLTLLGERIEPEYNDDIEEFLKKNPDISYTFTGAVKHEEVANYLQEADFWVSASIVEGQSIAMIEGLAAGLPVVATENVSSRELVTEKNGLLVPVHASPEEFAKQIEKVRELVRMHEITEVGVRESAAKFDWKSVIRETMTIYREQMGKSDRRLTLFQFIMALFLYCLSSVIAYFVFVVFAVRKFIFKKEN